MQIKFYYLFTLQKQLFQEEEEGTFSSADIAGIS